MGVHRYNLMVLFLAVDLWAATTDVTNVTQFQNALSTAMTNHEDDVINVAPTVYSLTSTLNYGASTNENKTLTIQCLAGEAVIDAGTIFAGTMFGAIPPATASVRISMFWMITADLEPAPRFQSLIMSTPIWNFRSVIAFLRDQTPTPIPC